MAAQVRFLGTDIPYPYLVHRHVTANNVALPRTDQPRIVPRGVRVPVHEPLYPREDWRRVDHVPGNRDGALYPPSPRQYDNLDPLVPGRRKHSYEGLSPYDAADEGLDPDRRGRRLSRDPSPYDAVDEELGFGRRGRQPLRDPPQHDADMKSGWRLRRPDSSPPSYTAANDQFAFDGGRNNHARKGKSGNDRLPFHSRDTGFGNLDKASFRDTSLGPRDSHSRRESHTSRDQDLNPMHGFRHRVQQGRDSQPNEHNGYSEIALMTHLCGGPSFFKDFPDQEPEENFHGVHARPLLRPNCIRHRSDFGLQSAHEDEITGSLWPPTAEEIKHRKHLVQMHGGFDTEDRQKAQVQEQYTHKDFEIENSGRGRRGRSAQMPQVTGPNPAASLFGSEFHHGRQAIRFRPRGPGYPQIARPNANTKASPIGHQQHNALSPAQITRLTPPDLHANTFHSSISLSPATLPYQNPEPLPQQEPSPLNPKSTVIACYAQQLPPHDSATTPQLPSPAPPNPANDPAIPAAPSTGPPSSPTEVLPRTQQYPPHTPPIPLEPNNNPVARDSDVPQESPAVTAQTARAEERVDWGSDSSDNGCDTPDEGSESEGSFVGSDEDEDGEGGGVIVETLVGIEL